MTKKERQFVHTVWEYYRRHGRQSLPWRRTRNPYRILVSEVMLQQTQVDRVILKYREFLKKFPTLRALAEAPLGDVLRVWQGLGYNRRAKLLHECAKVVAKEQKSVIPKTHESLVQLPGIGSYTAGAVLAFAYNIPTPIIETNIRSVYLHHFFNDATGVTDHDLFRLIEITLETNNPREWYYALMDYGVYLKRTYGNPNQKSKHYAKQSTFKGSDRQVRGAIIQCLTNGAMTRSALLKKLAFDDLRIDAQLVRLTEEGMVVSRRAVYTLP